MRYAGSSGLEVLLICAARSCAGTFKVKVQIGHFDVHRF